MKGSIRQRSKGSWQLRYEAPKDGLEKRIYLSETVPGTKKHAESVLHVRLSTIENGGYVPRDKETVAGFLEMWLQTYAATNTTLRTQEGYRGNIKRYIDPAIGSVPIQALTARHIQAMYAGLLEKGLSNRTVLHTHRVLKEALGHAVKWGMLPRNIGDAVTPPRPELKDLKMWDAEAVDQFLEAAADSRFRDLYHLAILTGMRRSELAGLKWENVDLANGQLSVVRTLQRILGQGLVEGRPKTAKSRRSIALATEAVQLLHGVRGRQIEQGIDLGPLWQNKGFVFTQEDGKPVNPPSISKDFAAIVRRAGLPHLTFHGLRHAHATLALSAGINPKVVSERLGHATIAMTMDTYSHVIPGLQEEAVSVHTMESFKGAALE